MGGGLKTLSATKIYRWKLLLVLLFLVYARILHARLQLLLKRMCVVIVHTWLHVPRIYFIFQCLPVKPVRGNRTFLQLVRRERFPWYWILRWTILLQNWLVSKRLKNVSIILRFYTIRKSRLHVLSNISFKWRKFVSKYICICIIYFWRL